MAIFHPVRRFLRALFLLPLLSSPVLATDVLSYHYDQQSTGQNLTETGLTPATVVPTKFRKRWATAVDGYVYAQPLYKAGVKITTGLHPGVHNTVFVATEHDSLYAFDSQTGEILWHRTLLSLSHALVGAVSITTVPAGPNLDTQTGDLVPEIGVTGTPVIDPVAGLLYAVAKSKQLLSGDEKHPRWVQTIFKVAIADGTIVGSDIIAATYSDQNGYEYRTNTNASAIQDPFVVCVSGGNGYDSVTVNGQDRAYFNALRQMNRPGLLLYNGSVYVAFASHGDNSPYHGWLLSFDAGTLALNGVFNTTPNGGLGGIWQGGGIPAVDAEGYFYFLTGNGTFDGNQDGMGGVVGLDNNGFPNMGDYGDCFVKLALDASSSQASQNLNGWGFKVVDYFAPMDNQTLSQNDTDLGSGGLMILPDSVGNTTHPHLVVGAGKEGKVYLVDRDNMGQFSPSTDNVVYSQANAISGSFSTPAYFNGAFYWAAAGDNAKIFSISNANSTGPVTFSGPVSTSNDYFNFTGSSPTITANGTSNGLVWILSRSPNQLRVYDASDLTQELWTSDMAANSRDALGNVVKFTTVTVADGLAFVGTQGGVFAYGGPPPPTVPPPAPSNLAAVALSSTDVELTWINHAEANATFEIEDSTDGVTFSEATMVGPQVTAANVTGLTPSTLYHFRVRAYNTFNGGAYSAFTNTATAATVPEPGVLDFSGGFTGSTSQLNYEGSASLTTGGSAQLTDGGGSESGAVWTQQKQTVTRFDTELTFSITPNGNGFADGFTFCVQNVNPTQVGGGGGDLGYAGIKKSIAIKVDVYPQVSTTGLYVDGAHSNNAAPPAINVGPSGINFASGDLFSLRLTYIYGVLTETLTDTVTNAVFTHQYAVNIPAYLGAETGYVGFTGGTGGQTSIQDIQTWVFATLPSAPPAAPSGLTAIAGSGTQINLSWKEKSTNEAGFVVERSASAHGPWSPLAVLPASPTTYSDIGLTNSARYYYRVLATNAAGLSAPSNEAEAMTPPLPKPPTAVRATSVQADAVALEWTPGDSTAESVIVARQEAGSGRHLVVATLPANVRSFVDRTVSAGVHYTYHLQASNLAGPSSSTDLEVTTPAP